MLHVPGLDAETTGQPSPEHAHDLLVRRGAESSVLGQALEQYGQALTKVPGPVLAESGLRDRLIEKGLS